MLKRQLKKAQRQRKDPRSLEISLLNLKKKCVAPNEMCNKWTYRLFHCTTILVLPMNRQDVQIIKLDLVSM